MNSGSARVSTLSCGAVLGTISLNGGTLSLSSLSYSAGATTINLNGGTLQAWKSASTWLPNNANLTYKLNGNVGLDSQESDVAIAASLSGTGTVTKVGSGSLALQNSNTLAAVTLNEGTLSISHAGALGAGTLTINGGKIDNTGTAAVSNSQNGPINITSNFTFVGTKDLNLGTGVVTLCRSIVVTNSAKTLTFGGSVGDGGSNCALTVTGSGMLALTGSLGIGGRITVSGGSSLTLAGANTYTGATTVSLGTLIVANSAALGTTNSASDVGSGSTMMLTNGAVVESEMIYIAGNGDNNRGALQAANVSTGTWNGVVMLNDGNTWAPRVGYKSSGVLIIGGPIKPSYSANSNLWVSGDAGSGRVVIACTNNTYMGITGIIRGALALGAGSCRLEFADSSSQAWTGTLDLTGTLIPTALRFGTSASGLTPEQLGRITVEGNPVWLGLNPNGYLRKITGTIFRLY